MPTNFDSYQEPIYRVLIQSRVVLDDVYDALVCKRVYKPAFTHEKAIKIINEMRGISFDPDVVDAFLEVQDRFKEISCNFTDS
jgi:putative two-component system response regulator